MEYQEQVTCSLRVFDELVVLPESQSGQNDNGVTTSTGVLNTNTTFNCNSINLRKGSRGEEVRKLQTILKTRGYYTRQIDGIFGTYTRNAVKKLQKAQGNTQDGWFGPKTCKKLQSTATIQAFQNTPTTNSTNSSVKSNSGNSFLITNIRENPSISYDLEGLSYEVTVNVPYTVTIWSHLRQLQKTDFRLYLNTTEILQHKGYINALKISDNDGKTMIEISIVGYNAFLEQGITIEKTATRSELYNTLIRSAGLVPSVNMNGFTDSIFTVKSQSAKNASSASASTVTLNGNDCTDTNTVSGYGFNIDTCKGGTKIGNSSANYARDTAHMTAKEAVLDVYNRFKYKYYYNNRTCPRNMWNKNGTITGNCADISRLIKCVGEVRGLKVGIHHWHSGSRGHYFNLIEVNGTTYRLDCCFKSGSTSGSYGGEICNTLTMRGGPWQ
jgi:peptidoglycan hydrolase-like protein with peptidoglycan-binding domain